MDAASETPVTYFDQMIANIRDPEGYAVWIVPVVIAEVRSAGAWMRRMIAWSKYRPARRESAPRPVPSFQRLPLGAEPFKLAPEHLPRSESVGRIPRMSTEDSIRLLQTVRKIASVRELEPLIGLVLYKVQSLAGADETVLTLLHKGTDTPVWFDANGRRTAVALDAVTSSACARVLRNQDSSWLEENGDTLILQLQAGDKAQGAVVLRGSTSDQSQLALLKEFAGYAGACIATALTFDCMAARIHFLENHDDLLTKLPNRTLFWRQLRKSLETASDTASLAVLYIDLDRFERINRDFGHSVGDAALCQVAQRMVAFSETRGLALPARIGGDEFALVVPQRVDSSPVEELANALLQDLRTPLKTGPVTSSITASAGIASPPPTGCTLEELMKAAERAMYKAKDLGGDHCFWYERGG